MTHLSRHNIYRVVFTLCLALTLAGMYFERQKLNMNIRARLGLILENEAYVCRNQSYHICFNLLNAALNFSSNETTCIWPVFDIFSEMPVKNFSNFTNIYVVKDDYSQLPNNDGTPLITGLLPHDVRLGNHMFNYASILGIAYQLKRRAFMQPSPVLEATFHLSHVEKHLDIVQWPMVVYVPWADYSTKFYKLIPQNDTCICGYLQSWRYFHAISSEIRKEFTFRNSTLLEVHNILQGILGNLSTIADIIVGVHVRRGDLHNKYYVDRGYRIAPISYYLLALDWMRNRFPTKIIMFLVISEASDHLWCRQNLQDSDIIIAPEASAAVHLALLASCDHVIISAGSFGWWGAWLTGGHVIYYSKYITELSMVGLYFSAVDYYPPEWIAIGD